MNSTVPGDRYRFTLAHELAHLVLHNHPAGDEEMETEADEFAAEFLMPAKEVRPYVAAPSLGRLGRAKAHWKVCADRPSPQTKTNHTEPVHRPERELQQGRVCARRAISYSP
jgi:hypothetical protein